MAAYGASSSESAISQLAPSMRNHDDGGVAAGLVVRVGMVLIRVGRLSLRREEGEVDI